MYSLAQPSGVVNNCSKNGIIFAHKSKDRPLPRSSIAVKKSAMVTRTEESCLALSYRVDKCSTALFRSPLSHNFRSIFKFVNRFDNLVTVSPLLLFMRSIIPGERAVSKEAASEKVSKRMTYLRVVVYRDHNQ